MSRRGGCVVTVQSLKRDVRSHELTNVANVTPDHAPLRALTAPMKLRSLAPIIRSPSCRHRLTCRTKKTHRSRRVRDIACVALVPGIDYLSPPIKPAIPEKRGLSTNLKTSNTGRAPSRYPTTLFR